MDAEKIKKMNALAKSLKDAGLVASMDDAAAMAEKMVGRKEETLAHFSSGKKGSLIAEAMNEEGFMDSVNAKVKELIGDVDNTSKRAEPIEESEEEGRKEPFILKKPEEKPEEIQEEISDIEKKEDAP